MSSFSFGGYDADGGYDSTNDSLDDSVESRDVERLIGCEC